YSQTQSEWYQYEGSHWRVNPGQPKYGIDWARKNGETPAVYAVNVLVGHHGWFSLTPIWVVAGAAMSAGAIRLRSDPINPQAGLPWFVAPMGLALSIIVIAFYLYESNNYGGWTQGLRWLMWLTPIWLTCLLPAADWLTPRRWGRGIAYVLLALSVLSA